MTARVLALLMVTLAFVAGCGGSKSSQPSSPASQPQSQQPAVPRLVIDITISGGNVTPTSGEFKAKAHEPIQLR